MKRWILFAVIFAAGLAVLWWLDRDRKRPPKPAEPAPAVVQTPEQGGLTEIPIGDGKTIHVGNYGPYVDSKFDEATGLLLYRLTAANHAALGDGLYRFDDLVVRYYAPGTETLRMVLNADTARGRLDSEKLNIDSSFPIELDGVVATMHEGLPLAPLTIKLPHASGRFADKTVTSSDRVEISGTGLSAEGVGLSFDGVAGELRLLKDTHATLKLDEVSTARLSAAGGLIFSHLGPLEDGARRVVANDRALLVLEGPTPLSVDADEVALEAQEVKDPDSRMSPTNVVARGSVRVRPADGTFYGDQARVEFDELGKPRSASLTGSPRVEMLLREVDTAVIPGAVASASDLQVNMLGAGPLVLRLGSDPRFDFGGPATLLLPSLDINLTAQQKLSGSRQGQSAFGRLDALGEVEVHAADSTVTAPALHIEHKLDAEGRAIASMITEGRTHAFGPLRDGGTFDLHAEDGLQYVRLGESFQVPRASGVDLVITGPNALHAKADEILDLDELTRTFTAIGNVSLESAGRSGRGQRLEVRGEERALLLGSLGAPACTEFEQGWLEAHEIEYDVDVLRAEGWAHANVGLEGAHYDLRSSWITLERTTQEVGQDLVLEAGGGVDLLVDEAPRKLRLHAEHVKARAFALGEELSQLETRGLVATGKVEFQTSGSEELSGSGERLVIEADRSGRLFPAEGRRVRMSGRMPKDDLQFEMSSGVVSFGEDRLAANDPDIQIEGIEVPLGSQSDLTRQVPLRAIAGTMSIDPGSILFTDGVYLGQSATPETTWSLDASKLVFTGERSDAEDPKAARFTISQLLAWDGFEARFGPTLRANGKMLLLERGEQRMAMRGEPANFQNDELAFQTTWLEVDLATGYLRSSAGTLRGVGEKANSFQLSYASMEPVHGSDSRIQVLREPTYIDPDGTREIRASWGLFWLDEQRLERASARLLSRDDAALPEIVEATRPRRQAQAKFFQDLEKTPIRDWLREAYLEGNIEVIEKGERRIRAEALYMDLVDGHGWVRDIDITMEMPFRLRAKKLKLHADWMRYSRDGSARAENAVATSCEFDDPHYEITLGDLRLTPRPTEKARSAIAAGRSEGADETDGYSVSATKNRLRLWKGPPIPIPKVDFPADKNFNVPADSFSIFGVRPFSFGNSAKFGTFVGVSFEMPLGWLSRRLHGLLGSTPELPEGRNSWDARYLNSRGLLLGWKNTIEQPGVYRLVTRFDFINDTGEDRGLVRVPEDDRDTFRGWLRMRGRRWLGDTEWVDLALSTQTDPGVQAEFSEGEYLRWEQRETYLHWRKAEGLNYYRASAEAELDNFRTEVMDQPTAGYSRARGPLARWLGHDLLYSSNTTAGRLNRVEGDPAYEDPFPDGFGEQEVLRMDTTQRVDMPIPLNVFGARLLPYIEGRGTIWDRGATDDETAARLALLAGAEVSATFWRMYGDGDVHSLTPTFGGRTDLVNEESGPTPAKFDEVENSLEGDVLEVGLRSRWARPRDPRNPEFRRFLDIELRQAHAEGLAGGLSDGWQPLRVNAQWLSALGSMPFGVAHDGRYDTNANETPYSRTFLGFRPVEPLEIETGYHSARDSSGVRLYNAWSIAARYNFSPKWQIEGSETLSTLSDSQLNSGFLVRRIGHDFVFEIEYSFVAGEGGGSVSFSLIPILTYRQPNFGLLDRWQKQNY